MIIYDTKFCHLYYLDGDERTGKAIHQPLMTAMETLCSLLFIFFIKVLVFYYHVFSTLPPKNKNKTETTIFQDIIANYCFFYIIDLLYFESNFIIKGFVYQKKCLYLQPIFRRKSSWTMPKSICKV